MDFRILVAALARIMASRPKRRKTTSQTGQTETQALVKECMAAALPVIESVVKECLKSRNLQSQESPSVQPRPAVPDQPSIQPLTETVIRDNSGTFQAIVSQSGIDSSSDLTAVPESNFSLGIAKPVGLDVDAKIKAKIYANEYIKLASLIPKSNFEQEPKFKSVEKDGQLVFIRASENGCIKTFPQWTEAFHVFVAIYCTKYPDEVGQLMTYAQIIHGIAKSCGDDAAISYDEKFRQWLQVAPRACPWGRKNSELYRDAIVQGLESQTKSKKQIFRASPPKQKYCFTYNNKGFCDKGNSCQYAHICQYCSNRHSRLQCTKQKQRTINTSKSVTNDHKKPATIARKV